MKKILIPFVLIALMCVQISCDQPTPDDPETSEKEWVKVLCEEATIEQKDADYVINGSNADYSVSITLVDAVEEGAGKYTQYKGSVILLETDEKEILTVEEAASFKLLDANGFQVVAKMKGVKVYYEITLEGTIKDDDNVEVKPELETEAITCTNATIDTIGKDFVFKASNEDWTVSITLPEAATDGIGKYLEYDGIITNTLNETEVLKVEDVAVFSLVNDTTFKLVAEMEGTSKVYAITLTGVLRQSASSQDPTNPDDPGMPEEPMSPDEQKNFLVEVGEQLIGLFNPSDQKKAVELADDLYYKYKKYNWDEIGEVFEDEWDGIYSAEFESFFRLPQRVIEVINGKRKASLQDLEILLTLSKFGRIIEFDDKNKTVKITKVDAPSITAKFSDSNNVPCELKVWGEGKEIEGSFTYEDYNGKRTIRAKIPTTIKMYLKHGSSTLISFNFKWDSNLRDYVYTSLDMQVINIGFQEETRVNETEASAVFSFTYNNKNIITAAASLPKYKIIPWEGGNDITVEAGETWLEEYADKYMSLLGKLGKGETKVDILGKIQLKGGVTDGAALIDAYYNWDDQYYSYNWNDYNHYYKYTYHYRYWDDWYGEYRTDSWEQESYYNAWWEQPSYSLQAKQDLCDLVNKYTYLSVYYNKGITEQAKLIVNTCEESGTYDPVYWERYYSSENEYYTNLPDPIHYTCYNVEPQMYFPQEDISIAVLTFFKSSKFLGLIDLVEELANSYIALDKHNLIFDEDFEVEFD